MRIKWLEFREKCKALRQPVTLCLSLAGERAHLDKVEDKVEDKTCRLGGPIRRRPKAPAAPLFHITRVGVVIGSRRVVCQTMEARCDCAPAGEYFYLHLCRLTGLH